MGGAAPPGRPRSIRYREARGATAEREAGAW